MQLINCVFLSQIFLQIGRNEKLWYVNSCKYYATELLVVYILIA
jgi:hypothetical protein